MNPKPRSRLGRCFDDFNQMVDDAIAMEEDLRLHHLEKRKAKFIAGPSGNVPRRPRLTYPQPRPQQMIVRPPQQNVQRPQYYRPAQQQNTPRPQYYRLLSRMSEPQLHPKDRDPSTHASTAER